MYCLRMRGDGMKKKRKQYNTVGPKTEPQPENAPARSAGHVQLGDIVSRRVLTFASTDAKEAQLMRGRVVYIHPAGRFHVVEFGEGKRAVRESFSGVRR